MKPVVIAVTFWAVVLLLPVGLAMPPALREKSWKRFFLALVLSFLGIVLPIFIFSASTFLVPEWKGGCRHGWLDCFHRGKLALLPFVLWASAALYALEILRVKVRTQPWIVHGIFLGAIFSTVCLIFGVITSGFSREENPWLLVPLYVAVWYVLRALRFARESKTSPLAYLASLCSTIPFWVASVVWSRKCFLALPDRAPDCFVVTAAMRGHASLVGPFIVVLRNGQRRQVNQQLITLWHLEGAWSQHLPRSHKAFRTVYNTLGPSVARKITSPLVADLVYLVIKPIEFLGRVVVWSEEQSKAKANQAEGH
jgi:hypothetical protein